MGIFANGHMSMEYKRDNGPKGQPSLEEMTKAAIKILKKCTKGFLLVVRFQIFWVESFFFMFKFLQNLGLHRKIIVTNYPTHFLKISKKSIYKQVMNEID